MKKRKRWNDSRVISIVIVAFAVTTAGLAFMYKLYEFIAASVLGDLPIIITASILPYFFVSGGFLFLAAWAWLGGHYKNIEGPKYDMLRQEEEYARLERTRKDQIFY